MEVDFLVVLGGFSWGVGWVVLSGKWVGWFFGRGICRVGGSKELKVLGE